MSDTKQVDWFAALGNEVPKEQRDAAIEEARKMGVEVPDNSLWVDEVAKHVENDRPEHAIDRAKRRLDLTGAYRFLAALCTPRECYADADS